MKFDSEHKRIAESVTGPKVKDPAEEQAKYLQIVAEVHTRSKAKEKGIEHGGTQFGTELDADFVAGSIRSPATIIKEEKAAEERVESTPTPPKKMKAVEPVVQAVAPIRLPSLMMSVILRRGNPSSLILTVPKEIVEGARLEAGDQLLAHLYEDGEVQIRWKP